jgi:hypothetical protein
VGYLPRIELQNFRSHETDQVPGISVRRLGRSLHRISGPKLAHFSWFFVGYSHFQCQPKKVFFVRRRKGSSLFTTTLSISSRAKYRRRRPSLAMTRRMMVTSRGEDEGKIIKTKKKTGFPLLAADSAVRAN